MDDIVTKLEAPVQKTVTYKYMYLTNNIHWQSFLQSLFPAFAAFDQLTFIHRNMAVRKVIENNNLNMDLTLHEL